MKLQFGMVFDDGRNATLRELLGLMGHYASRSFQTSGNVVDEPLAMAYRGDRLRRQDAGEIQPLTEVPYVLTWDGRLDNRDEIAGRCDLTEVELLTDAAIVMGAYRKFGEAVLADLVGEFALCLWCKDSRDLVMARSFGGERLLYYTHHDGVLMWCSDFAHLVRVSNVRLKINESYLFEYLLSQPNAVSTPFEEVNAVPPNTVLRFCQGELQSHGRLWDPGKIQDVRYGSDSEYEEHCLHVMREAVEVRMTGVDCVFSELSGGLDSSSVVCLGDLILREEGRNPASFQTVSCVFEESETCDEKRFVEAVAEARGIPSHLISECEQAITMGLSDSEFPGVPTPFTCYGERYRAFARRMAGYGAQVLMTGLGGDHLFWSEPDGVLLVADELAKGNLARMHRECTTWSRFAGIPYWRMLLTTAVPLTLGRFAPSLAQFRRPKIPSWITPSYRERAKSLVWEYTLSKDSSGSPSRRAQLRGVENLIATVSAGYWSQFSEIHLTHPYLHRPLVEFCIGTPLSQFLRNGETRSLMRRTMQGILPEKVRIRKSKGIIDEAFARAVQREWEIFEDLESFEVCKLGLVDRKGVESFAEKLFIGASVVDEHLERVVSLEYWLRHVNSFRSNGVRVISSA